MQKTLSFNIDTMTMAPLIPLEDNREKGWSYSYVYYLRNLKDIYLLYYYSNGIFKHTDLLTKCIEHNLISESGKKWNNRYLLEITNALKNFELINTNNQPIKGKLFESDINQDLTLNDKKVFANIYNNYFRFQEFHQLFIDENGDRAHSHLVYAYMDKCRFFNRFIRPDLNTIFYIEDSHQDMMRFWDVYTKWGATLNLLNKCSVTGLEYKLNNSELTNLYVLNITYPIPSDFSIINFMIQVCNDNYVYIPELERELIAKYKFSIKDIKERLIEEIKVRNNEYRLQKTSEIFVNNNTASLLPELNNTYMSHILKI